MSETADSGQLPKALRERSFSDRRPLTAVFVVVEIGLLLLAGVFFMLGEPMAPEVDTASMIGGLILVVVIMVGVVGAIVFAGNLLVKQYVKLQTESMKKR